MTSPIVALWQEGQLPIEDGVFFADDRTYAVEVEDGRLVAVEELDLAEVLAEDPTWVTTIDITGEVELPAGGFLCVGEGSHGSEGFFARLDEEHQLVWVCYLSESNPFKTVTYETSTATVTSTSGVTVTVDLDNPVHLAA